MDEFRLNDPALFREANYINGKWVDALDGRAADVTNPATGEKIGTVPMMSQNEVRSAIDAADLARHEWQAMTAGERAAILKSLHRLMLENTHDLAMILTMEQGKPLAEAKGEIAYAASFIEWFAEEARRIYGDIIPENVAGRRILVQKKPIGVFAAITPWNFPSAMITRKVGPGWATGCTAVIKPALETPYSALALAELAHRAGMPPGVCNVITGDAAPIGRELCENPKIRKISFTGSTAVGTKLMRQCAPTIKKLSLELGGNAPFIVFDDADIDAAVKGAVDAKFRNSGQTCVCADRFLIHDAVYDEFAQKLASAVCELKVGNGFADGISQGPLINRKAVDKVLAFIDDAVNKGAQILTGGVPHSAGENFFEPTILSDISSGARIFNEETFGPVAALMRFRTEAEAVRLANDSPFGLAAYFYSRDIGRVFRVAEAIEAGIIGINEGLISTEVAPFGGVKMSGLGREGSKYGVDDYLEIKYLCLGGIEHEHAAI